MHFGYARADGDGRPEEQSARFIVGVAEHDEEKDSERNVGEPAVAVGKHNEQLTASSFQLPVIKCRQISLAPGSWHLEADYSYAIFFFPLFRFIGEVVRVAFADYLARFRAIGWADDAALFENVHQPCGARVADAEFPLEV